MMQTNEMQVEIPKQDIEEEQMWLACLFSTFGPLSFTFFLPGKMVLGSLADIS